MQFHVGRQLVWATIFSRSGLTLALLKIARPFAKRWQVATTAPRIEKFFLLFTGWCLAVVGTPLVATLPAMVLSATERTPQIRAARIAGMCQKPNPAMDAVHRTVYQFGMVFQNRIQRGLVLTHNWLGAIVLVPVVRKRENFLDCQDKKTRLPVILWNVSFTPSS